jgi:Fic-DOC domain mobile mystery protein B
LFGSVWDWAETFRRTGKNIGIDPVHIAVELRMLTDSARYWAKAGTHSRIDDDVRFYHRMVQIHPFPNGNGWHARNLADTVLTRVYRAPPIDWAGGYDLQKMDERRSAYIAALKAADRGDFAPLLVFAALEPPRAR